MDITQKLLKGDMSWYEKSCDPLSRPEQAETVYESKIIQRYDTKILKDKSGSTRRWKSKHVVWALGLTYDHKSELTFFLHLNTFNPGVNILVLELENNTLNLVSSGELSGCTYAWFVIQKNDEMKLVFLHAGASGDSLKKANVASDKELRNIELMDICNGLNAVFDMRIALTLDKDSEIGELVKALESNDQIVAGQIICPRGDEQKEVQDRKIQTLCYSTVEHYFGECLCLIADEGGKFKITGVVKAVNKEAECKTLHYSSKKTCILS